MSETISASPLLSGEVVSERGLILCVIVTAILVRLPFLWVPIDADEGGYLYVAQFWTHTYRLYRDIPFDRPPGIFLIYKGILALAGTSGPALRIAAAAWNAGTAVIVARFTADASGSRSAALASGLLFALTSTSPHIEGFLAQAELFTSLPLVGAAYATWKERWTWAGVLAGIATVIKPTGICGLLLAAAWWAYRRPGWRGLAGLVCGYAVVGCVTLFGVWLIDWQAFVAQQQLKLGTILDGTTRGDLVVTAIRTAPAWLGVAVLAATSVAINTKRLTAFGSLWLAASFIGMRMGGEWWPHYVIQIVPGLAWMAGPAFVSARTRRRAIAGATLTVALLLAYDAPIGAASPADAARQINQAPAVVYQAAITDYVQSITESSDPIQVVFLAPSVYASAHRRAAVPHFYFYEYRSQRKLIEDVLTAIDRRVPAAVVVVGPLFHATTGYIRKRVEGAGYIDGQHFGPVVVYRRGGQHRK